MSVDTRNYTINASLQLVTEECINCGITFAMPAEFRQQCLDAPNRKKFYCPNGHWMWYTGKSDVQKLREATQQLEREQTRTRAAYDQLHASERSNRAYRGVITRTKRRIANGVCPCCRRHFDDLAAHMSGQHPGYAEEA